MWKNFLLGALTILLIICLWLMLTNRKSTFVDIPDIDVRGEYTATDLAKMRKDRADILIESGKDVKSMLEKKNVDENLLYYALPQCQVEGEPDYSVDKYGEEKSFMDYVKSNLVSPDMERNHAEYVDSDIQRLGTGRTISYDMHDSYDPIPWAGLFRPQNVPVGTPDQIPDVDRSLYRDSPTIRW